LCNEEQKAWLITSIQSGNVTAEQISLMGSKLAAQYADAVATGD
jgi:hypothetical protein